MAVTLTQKTLVIPIRKHIVCQRDILLERILKELRSSKKTDKPAVEPANICENAWRIILYGVGDGTGGAVSATVDFSEMGDELYYLITDIRVYQNDGTDPFITTNTDQWEALHVPGATDITILLYTAETNNNYGIPGKEEPPNWPIYLGKPRTADAAAGEISAGFTTNTNTKIYNMMLQGLSFRDPLDQARLLRGNIF